ncbi:TetR/AcrR family transcriptional regulator [Streptomyces sp. NPDC059092]|uniref:TetR/AcrR family transcriptional regulator n=1 Tax=Streptomyces sp. NPDC059092 TaxID=3346725 RepID=UPI0036BB8415
MDPGRNSADTTSSARTRAKEARTDPSHKDPNRTDPARTGQDRTEQDRTGQDRRAARRERLLMTATDLFTTRGYPATSIERICATAHVSIRAFYEEFEGREALLIALHNDVARAGMEAALTVLSDPGMESAGARARISALTRSYLAAVTAEPAATRIAFVEVVGAGRAVEEHRLLWRSLWSDFLSGEAERAVERGEAVPRDYSLAIMALIGAINELVAHWARDATAFPRELLADELVHHALATLGIPNDGNPSDSIPADGLLTDEGK